MFVLLMYPTPAHHGSLEIEFKSFFPLGKCRNHLDSHVRPIFQRGLVYKLWKCHSYVMDLHCIELAMQLILGVLCCFVCLFFYCIM